MDFIEYIVFACVWLLGKSHKGLLLILAFFVKPMIDIWKKKKK